jgi:hypothetical protein
MNPWESLSQPSDQIASNQRIGLVKSMLVVDTRGDHQQLSPTTANTCGEVGFRTGGDGLPTTVFFAKAGLPKPA